MRTRRSAYGWLLVAGIAVAASTGYLGWRWLNQRRLEHRQNPVILAAARRYGVEPALVKAVIWRESAFNPRALGRAGEVGLMQVTDAAAQEWAEAAGVYPLPETHLFDARTNVMAGTWYLAKLLRRYAGTDDPRPYALADYNAGRGNVLKWMQGEARHRSAAFREAIGFPSTKRYVTEVLARRRRYLGKARPPGRAGSEARDESGAETPWPAVRSERALSPCAWRSITPAACPIRPNTTWEMRAAAITR